MDVLDKAITEVRAVLALSRKLDGERFNEVEAEKHAIAAIFTEWIGLPEVSGNPSFMVDFAEAISAAFAAGWVGGREWVKGRCYNGQK